MFKRKEHDTNMRLCEAPVRPARPGPGVNLGILRIGRGGLNCSPLGSMADNPGTMQTNIEASLGCLKKKTSDVKSQGSGNASCFKKASDVKPQGTRNAMEDIPETKEDIDVPPAYFFHSDYSVSREGSRLLHQSQNMPFYQPEVLMWPIIYPGIQMQQQQHHMNVFDNHLFPMNSEGFYPAEHKIHYMPYKMFPQGYPHELQFQEFQYFVVIDFEATCEKDKILHPQEIIEFPSVLVNSCTGCQEASFQTYVRPVHHQLLTDFCKELTGIQQIQVAHQENIRKLRDMVIDNAMHTFKESNFLSTKVGFGGGPSLRSTRRSRGSGGVIAANLWTKVGKQVDKGVSLSEALLLHDKWLEDKGIKHKNFAVVTWSDWDCRVMLETECRFKGIRKPHYFNQWINLKVPFQEVFGGVRCNLKEAVQLAGLAWEGRAHCGLDDARNTARLLSVLMRQGFRLSITNSLTQHSIERPNPSSTTQILKPKEKISGQTPLQYQPSMEAMKERAIYCFCGVKSSKCVVRKPGPTQGRYFFGCGNWTGSAACDYFVWEETKKSIDLTSVQKLRISPVLHGAVISGSNKA
ncbi:putative exonuclease domain-containing protein [Dendrobium catenatum]|uniref:Putative exonuclease domain-containing protein n=1 Tax=Dendrobium catenatum TaxID=906689 RepID=A0A2I0VHZ1_9ASPA|nr:putative exonuclease domain-containing protein [Dendrobium catenatum]